MTGLASWTSEILDARQATLSLLGKTLQYNVLLVFPELDSSCGCNHIHQDLITNITVI